MRLTSLKLESVQDLFLEELRDLYDAENQLAKRLGYQHIATILQQTLEEEGEADKKLTAVAENEVNARATASAP